MTDQYELNDGHIHEAMDRIDVAIGYLQSALAEHSLIFAVGGFEEKVQASIEILAALYQEVGQHDHVAEIAAKYGLKQGFGVRESQP